MAWVTVWIQTILVFGGIKKFFGVGVKIGLTRWGPNYLGFSAGDQKYSRAYLRRRWKSARMVLTWVVESESKTITSSR